MTQLSQPRFLAQPLDPSDERLSRLFDEPVMFAVNRRAADASLSPYGPPNLLTRLSPDEFARLRARQAGYATEADDPGRDLMPDYDPDFDAGDYLARKFADVPERVQPKAATGGYDHARNVEHLAEMVKTDLDAARLADGLSDSQRREGEALARGPMPIQLAGGDPAMRQAVTDLVVVLHGTTSQADPADAIEADTVAAQVANTLLSAGATVEDVQAVAQAIKADASAFDESRMNVFPNRGSRIVAGAGAEPLNVLDIVRDPELKAQDDQQWADFERQMMADERAQAARRGQRIREGLEFRDDEAALLAEIRSINRRIGQQTPVEQGTIEEIGIRIKRGVARPLNQWYSRFVAPLFAGEEGPEGYKARIKTLEEFRDLSLALEKLPVEQHEGLLAAGFFGAFEAAPDFAMQVIPSLVVPGGAMVRMALFVSAGVAPVYADTVQTAYAETGDWARANEEASVNSLVTIGTNAIPAYAIVGKLPGGQQAQRRIAQSVAGRLFQAIEKRAVGRVAGGGVAEAVQEMTEQVGQELAAAYYRDKEIDWRVIPIAGIGGLMLGAAGRAGVEARFRGAIRGQEQFERAKQEFMREAEADFARNRIRLTPAETETLPTLEGAIARLQAAYATVAEEFGPTAAESVLDPEMILANLPEGITAEQYAAMTDTERLNIVADVAKSLIGDLRGRIELSPETQADVDAERAAGVEQGKPEGAAPASETPEAPKPAEGTQAAQEPSKAKPEGKAGESPAEAAAEVAPTPENRAKIAELRKLGLSFPEAKRRIATPELPQDEYAARANARGLPEGEYKPLPGMSAVGRITALGDGSYAIEMDGDGTPDVRPDGQPFSWAEAVAELDRRTMEANGVEPGTDAAAMAHSFITERGSTYSISGQTTQRNKIRHPLHTADDAGPQPSSQRTVYVDEESASVLDVIYAAGFPEGKSPQISIEGDRIRLVSWSGKGFDTKKDRTFAFSDQPKIGMQPVEFWPNAVHIGTPIVSIETDDPNGLVTVQLPGTPPENRPDAEAIPPATEAFPTWETMKPGQDVTLYRGEGAGVMGQSVDGGEWWTTNKALAEKYGAVKSITVKSDWLAKNAAQGHNGPHEFWVQGGEAKLRTAGYSPAIDRAAYAALGPGHAKLAASLDALVAEGTMRPASVDLALTLLQGADDAYLETVKIASGEIADEAGRQRTGATIVRKRQAQILIARQLALKTPEASAADIHDLAVLFEEYFHAAEQMLLTPEERTALQTEYAKRTPDQWAEYFRNGIAGGDKQAAAYAASSYAEWIAHLGVEHALGRALPTSPEVQGIIARLVQVLRDAIGRLKDRGYMKPDMIALLDRMLAGQASTISQENVNGEEVSSQQEAPGGQQDDAQSPAASTGRKRISKAAIERSIEADVIAGAEGPLESVNALIAASYDDPQFTGIETFGITPDTAAQFTGIQRARLTNAGVAISWDSQAVEHALGDKKVHEILERILGGKKAEQASVLRAILESPERHPPHHVLNAMVLSKWESTDKAERTAPREMLDPAKLIEGNGFELFGVPFTVLVSDEEGGLVLSSPDLSADLPLRGFIGFGESVPADIGTFEEEATLPEEGLGDIPFGRDLPGQQGIYGQGNVGPDTGRQRGMFDAPSRDEAVSEGQRRQRIAELQAERRVQTRYLEELRGEMGKPDWVHVRDYYLNSQRILAKIEAELERLGANEGALRRLGLSQSDLRVASAFHVAPTVAFAYGVRQYLGGYEQAHRARDMTEQEYSDAVDGYRAAKAGASDMQRQGAEFLSGQARADDETGMLFGRAFHGSPYTFDRFSTSKIGTGEGAQAYGHGIYFSSKREVAQFYQKSVPGRVAGRLGPGSKVPTTTNERISDVDRSAAEELSKALITNASAIEPLSEIDVISDGRMMGVMRTLAQNLQIAESVIRLVPVDVMDVLAGGKSSPEMLLHNPSVLVDLLPVNPDDLVASQAKAMNILAVAMAFSAAKVAGGPQVALRPNELLSAFKTGDFRHLAGMIPQPSVFRKQPRLYEVELAPQEDEYLLWDRPLSEQSEKVKAALAPLRTDEYDLDPARGTDVETGGTAYARIGDALLAKSDATIEDMIVRGGRHGAEQELASTYLHSLGIRGIKYLDGSSRQTPFKIILTETGEEMDGYATRAQAEEMAALHNDDAKREGETAKYHVEERGDFNYVIFSEDDVQITQMFGRAAPDDLAQPPISGPPPKPGLSAEPAPVQRPRIKIDPADYRVARRHDITPQTRIGRATQAPLVRIQLAAGRVVERFLDHRPLPSTTLAFSPNAAITAIANILDHIGSLVGHSNAGGVYSGSRAVTEMAYLRQWNARSQSIRDDLDGRLTAAIGQKAALRGTLETLGWNGMRNAARMVRRFTSIPWQRINRLEREVIKLTRKRLELVRLGANLTPRQQADLSEIPAKIDQAKGLIEVLKENFERELTVALTDRVGTDEVRKVIEDAFAAFAQANEELAKHELAQSEAAPLIRRKLGDAADYAVVNLNADYVDGSAGLDRIVRWIYGVTEEQADSNAPFKPGQWVMAMDQRNYGQVVQIDIAKASAKVRWINRTKGTSAVKWLAFDQLMPAGRDQNAGPLAPGAEGAVEMKDSKYWRQGGPDRPPLNPDDPADMQEIVRQINADRIAFKVEPETPFVQDLISDPAVRFDDLETRSWIAGKRREAIDSFFLDAAKRELGLWDTPIGTWEALLRTIELGGEEVGLNRNDPRQRAINAAGIRTLGTMIDYILERQQSKATDHAVIHSITGGVVEGVRNYTVARSLRTAWLSVGTESSRLVTRQLSRSGLRRSVLDFTKALYGQLREMTPAGRDRFRAYWDSFLSTASISHTTRAAELAGFDPVTKRRLAREEEMRQTMSLTGWLLGGLPLALTREAASYVTTGRVAGGRKRVPILRHATLEEGALAERRASLAMTNSHLMRILPTLGDIHSLIVSGAAPSPGEAVRQLRKVGRLPIHVDAHDYIEVMQRISPAHLERLITRLRTRDGIGTIMGMDYFEGHAPEVLAYKGYLDYVGRYVNSATPTAMTRPITLQEDRGFSQIARFLFMFRSWAMADATQAGRMALTQSQGRNFALFTAQMGASLAIKFIRTMLYFGFGAAAWQKWEDLWDEDEIKETIGDVLAYANLWGPSEILMQPLVTALFGSDWRREQLARGNIHPAASAIEDASRAALYTAPKGLSDDNLTAADWRRLRRVSILPETFPFMLWKTPMEQDEAAARRSIPQGAAR